ncbi:MAG: hypothetical protein LLG02_14995 [Pelosinus sp.]|nr:hypothetical protein [Pelosinus sp.]
MELVQTNTCQAKDIIWDTVNNRICFDIKPNSIGVNQRIIVAKNRTGRIEMHIQNIIGKPAMAGS